MEKKENRTTLLKMLHKTAAAEGLESTMKLLELLAPSLIPTKYMSIKKNLQAYLVDKTNSLEARFSYESFNFPKELLYWYENEKDEKTLVLNGKSGTGKTESLITFLNSKGLNPILIKDLNRLRDLKSSNKAIILDDVDLSKLSSEELITLFDKTRDSEVRVLYDVIKISKDVIKTMTTNDLKKIVPDSSYFEPESRKAIRRRIYEIEVDEKLYKTNINVSGEVKGDVIINILNK